jgi:hypothetical protein
MVTNMGARDSSKATGDPSGVWGRPGKGSGSCFGGRQGMGSKSWGQGQVDRLNHRGPQILPNPVPP